LGDQMTKLAGKIADGIIVNMANPATVRRIIENVRAGAAEAGRDPGAIEIAVKVRCAINEDREVAKRKLKQVLTFYNLADHYKDLVASMGFAVESQRIRDAYAAGGFKAAMVEVTDGMVDGLPTIAATSAAEVRERVRPWIDAGATRLIIPPVPCTDDPVREARGFLRGWRT
ncbi:MAG: LLM class flavin-dependent oxidoreductase, partial [Candidatus Limnocylindria bacterium]|nr:LLM class flavin-dependent oxidoreductase [Candidatus Limnocylindria bacterium]